MISFRPLNGVLFYLPKNDIFEICENNRFRPLNGVLFYLLSTRTACPVLIEGFSSPQRGSFLSTEPYNVVFSRHRFRPLNGVLFYLPCLSQPPESRGFQTGLRRKPDSFAESFQKIHIFFKTLYFMGCGAKYCFKLVGMSYIPYPYHTIFPRILYTYIREVLFSSQYPLHVYAFYMNFPTYFYKYYR